MDTEQTGLVLKAINFAACKHRDQRRKDLASSPYINHPISLANLLWHEADVTDIAVIIAALLHDTVEDTQTTFEELKQFGQDVPYLVKEVTDNKSLPKQTRKQLQITQAAGLSERAKLIVLADKIANLRDINSSSPVGWSKESKQEYLEWAKSVVDQIRGTHSKLEALFDQAYQQGYQRISV